MPVVTRPRGRPPKYPPDEVRRRLLGAARECLKLAGVESGLDAVTLDGAIMAADVPRGMSYRIWQDENHTPQEAFRRAAVLDLLSIPATAGLPASRAANEELFEQYRDVLENGTLAEREALKREGIRQIGGFNYRTLAESSNWKLYSALRIAAMTRPNVDPAIIDALVEGENYLVQQYSLWYEDVTTSLGMELRPGLKMEQFAAAAYAVNEGLALRFTNFPDREGIVLTDPDGVDREWTLFSIAFEGIIDRFFELVERK